MSVGDVAKKVADQLTKEIRDKMKKFILIKVVPVVALVAALVSLLVVITGAISGDGGGTSTSGSYGTGIIYGNTIQEKVWYGLISLGYSEISTAAAMGNIHYESGSFNPNSIEDNNPANEAVGGIGICQWTNNWDNGQKGSTGRCTDLKAYAASKGLTWRDENVQVEFLLAELSGGGAGGYAKDQLMDTTYTGTSYKCSEWKNATDTETLDESKLKWLTEVFCFTFERPRASDGIGTIDTRYGHALNYYNQFHGTQLPNFINGDLYNSDGTVREDKMLELERNLEVSHNLVASGQGFVNMYGSDNGRNLAVKRQVTGQYHGYSYTSGNKAYGNNGLEIYQCTWWANGRASEYLSQYGTKYKRYPTTAGNGGDYYAKNKANGWFNYGSEPKPNSLFSYNPINNIYGHITYVEAVDYVNRVIYVSEAGGGRHWDGICKYTFAYCQQQIAKGNYGFIYLAEPK